MGTNFLVKALRENSSKNERFFDCNASVISYKTGIPVLDYYLGYRVNVFNKETDELIEQYPCIGITAGSYATFIGKPSTGKTTTAIQIASNIVRDFDNGFVMHFDLEQAMNYTRIKTLSRFKASELEDKYILRQEQSTIADIKKAIMKIYKMKTEDPDKYKYNTGKKNEFGEDIVLYVPTVVIIDSIATLSTYLNENDKSEAKKLEEVGTQTDRMRTTGEIGRFYTELLPFIRTANILIISINHIKVNPNMGVVKSPSELLYLDQNETLPGGKAPQFLAHILLKFVAAGSEKFTEEDNGFGGFGLNLKIIKSRVGENGRICHLIYDKVRGIDSLRSTVDYAKECGLLGGNKNGYYFIDNKDQKFPMVGMHEAFKENKDLYSIMYSTVIPVLEQKLSTLKDGEEEIPEEELNY